MRKPSFQLGCVAVVTALSKVMMRLSSFRNCVRGTVSLESVDDTIVILESLEDVIVIFHPQKVLVAAIANLENMNLAAVILKSVDETTAP